MGTEQHVTDIEQQQLHVDCSNKLPAPTQVTEAASIHTRAHTHTHAHTHPSVAGQQECLPTLYMDSALPTWLSSTRMKTCPAGTVGGAAA